MKAAAGFIYFLCLLASQASAAPSENLTADARRAAVLLATHQQAPGYWLTSHTPNLRFERPLLEMNTFLAPVITDLLAPVAEEAGLGPNMLLAHKQITSQIEDTGLVRYHGRPNSLVPQWATCVISPDTDDTALAWRIAPAANRALLRKALATLDQYRRPDGLYMTWLAPRDRYQCVDMGKDPDPADVGIQMHVLMFLAKAKPRESRALCEALKKSIAEDRLWVYYQIAPLIPMLRQADLTKAGCSLKIPASRLKVNVPGQDIWIATALALLRLSGDSDGHRNAAGATALLQQLAKNNFADIRRSPPLLYHNDMTAKSSQFYWSEDFGYALWLRLYFETLHHS